MTHFLGVDIGTFESKGVLVDAKGEIVAMASRPHKLIVPQPGWAEHRPNEDWWGDFVAITRDILRQSGISPKDIAAIGCSAIGACMLPVDAAGEPLMNGVLYGVDTRASAEVDELNASIGADRLLDVGGSVLTSQSVGPKILWLKRNRPEIYARAAKIGSSTTFIVHHLTGRHVIDHHTAGYYQPLYDADAMGWNAELCQGIIEPGRLPDLLWANEVAGAVTAAAAAATGLAEGTPVIAGTIDAAAEALSVGVRKSGQMMMMYGSTVFIIMVTEQRVRDPRLWYAPYLFKGQHAATSGLATSGTLSHWFRDNFARELATEEAFATLAAEAAEVPAGSRGLIMLPHFSGERTPIHDPQAKGVIFGLNLTHTRADIYRALYEGIAYATGAVIEAYVEAGHPPRDIEAVGGGTKNSVWLDSVSNVSGLTQSLRSKTIGASYGDAFLAALAIGAAQPDDIDRWNPIVRTISPDQQKLLHHQQHFAIFKRLYQQTKDLMHALG